METEYTSPLDKIFRNLKEHGSWINIIEYRKLFDPYDPFFQDTPTREKLLQLKEYNFCGVSPITFNILYRAFCIEEGKQEIYNDLGQALLEIINSTTAEDVSNLDIHDLSNWYKGREENPKTVMIHFVIKNTLAGMDAKLHQQLIKQKDFLIRKRIILTHYSSDNREIKVVKNDNPIFDQIDEELLAGVDTYDKNDNDSRSFSLEQLVWGLYEKLSNQNIVDPLGWYNRYMDTESDSHPLKIHDMIRHTLVDMSAHLHQLLIDEENNQVRMRLILMHNSMRNFKQRIVKNTDPVFDKIDEELLSRVGLLDKEDPKARYIALEELVEDLRDKFDSAHKKQKQDYAQRLVTHIEGLHIEELKTMSEYSSYNLENVLQAKKNPKEWLYSKVRDSALMREIEKIRPKIE